MDYLQAASVPCGGAKIKTLVVFLALARADLARLTPPNALPITRRDHASAGMRGSGECPERQRGRTVNPLADAFVGSSPTSPTSLKKKRKIKFGRCSSGHFHVAYVALFSQAISMAAKVSRRLHAT